MLTETVLSEAGTEIEAASCCRGILGIKLTSGRQENMLGFDIWGLFLLMLSRSEIEQDDPGDPERGIAQDDPGDPVLDMAQDDLGDPEQERGGEGRGEL